MSSVAVNPVNCNGRRLPFRSNNIPFMFFCECQECKQHMIYLNAACVNYGFNRTSGEDFGNRLTSLDFIEIYQKIWDTHFGPHLFQADTISETLLYNLMVSLQVSADVGTNLAVFVIS